MRIDLGNVEINRPSGDPGALWSMPSYPGGPLVNMGDPNFRPPTPAAARRTPPMPSGQSLGIMR